MIAPCREFSSPFGLRKKRRKKRNTNLNQTGCNGNCNPLLHKVVDLSE
ncbi:MAG: hypothetical protein OJF51_000376 [Nitrospira sp.]|nr:MAG: hypothetical protein OJF51_000376 [Nitrospira sp.]